MATTDEATASYLLAGFANKMGWGSRPALLLVDVCLAYWTQSSPLDLRAHAPSAAAPDSMRRLLAAARRGNVPVIWTQGEYTDADMKDAGLFYLKTKNIRVMLVGSELNHLNGWLPGLEPAASDLLIKKKYPSAFFGTTLAGQLHLLNADTVVVCGVSTSGCVRATTLDAMCHGFRPMVRFFVLSCLFWPFLTLPRLLVKRVATVVSRFKMPTCLILMPNTPTLFPKLRRLQGCKRAGLRHALRFPTTLYWSPQFSKPRGVALLLATVA
jgi:nicotinamidase-related amidase